MASEKFVWSRAQRESIKAKVTLEAPSGGGKTTAALLMAYGLCGDWSRICVCDTENRRSLYAVGQVFGDVTVGEFMHMPLTPPYSPWRMSEALVAAERSGEFDVFIFDSLSKEWEGVGGTLELVGNAGQGSNQFTAWKGPGDAHRRFIDSIQFSSMHVVCTMRSKVKYDLVEEYSEKKGGMVSVPKKRGMEAIARSGTEYEFDVSFRLDMDHAVEVSKDNTRVFVADPPGTTITPDHGKRIIEWSKGAACQVGAPGWVALRLAQLDGYGGSEEGLKALWTPIYLARSAILPADLATLTAAKDRSKARITKGAS